MKALVVGGTGPCGPFIVEGLLKRGYEITIFHRGTHEIEFSQPVEHLHGDPHFMETLQQALEGRKFDLVIAMYGRLRYVADVVKGKTPRLIAIGGTPYSALVDGDYSRDNVPVQIPEDAPLHMDAKISKFNYLMVISEQAVMEAHQQGHYSVALMRFPFVYGPRQLAPWEWSIIRRILDGRKHIIIPDSGLKLQRRGYAENMAYAVLLAVDNPVKASGEIYNTGDNAILSLRTWVETIAKIMNYDLEQIYMPFEMARPSRAYAGRPIHNIPDITKIKKELGYEDLVPAAEGIRKTVEWLLENRPEPNGELEQRLTDSFNYSVEDQLIQEYRKVVSSTREVGNIGYQWRHPYDHPKGMEQS